MPRLFSLFAEVLPPLADGPEARAWIAEHDVIDHGLLDRALAAVPTADAARVRDACAAGRRIRVTVDATAYPKPDAWRGPWRDGGRRACRRPGSGCGPWRR
jgi:hypothetical protein